MEVVNHLTTWYNINISETEKKTRLIETNERFTASGCNKLGLSTLSEIENSAAVVKVDDEQ